MEDTTITDGQLLAYLEGEDLPQVAQALAASATLRARLDELREADAFLRQAFAPLRRPSPADMVDVVAGQGTPAARAVQTRRAAWPRAAGAVRRLAQLRAALPAAARRAQAAPEAVAELESTARPGQWARLA